LHQSVLFKYLPRLIPKPNPWTSRYKFPQTLFPLHFSAISYSFLGSDAMSTKLMSIHYILEGHKLNTDQPEKISPQLLSVFVLQDTSQWKCCVPVWTTVHTQDNRAPLTLVEPEGPIMLANGILRLSVLSVRYIYICSIYNSLIIHISTPAITILWYVCTHSWQTPTLMTSM
jgi:hypothetical protein